jgi:D-alanine-D-alanine ligase
MAKKTDLSNNGVKTLGPISDLEKHLPSDWWQSLFNSLYLKTDGDVVENHANTAYEVDMLTRTACLEPNDKILDLCCGQGRHCLELAKRGFRNLIGIDRSRYLIRLARKRAKQANLNIAFHEGDARRFRLPEGFCHCVALMGNSFGYFDREDDDFAVLEAVKRVLTSSGTLVMDLVDGDWMRNNFEPRSWEWIDKEHFVCRERSLSADGEKIISREVVVHSERGVIADQFYAERLYSYERISQFLERVDFVRIELHDRLSAESNRNQDLGMMAHRMFITAKAPPKVVLSTKRGPLFPEVTVLMGDPALPDSVKRSGKFNPEDFETINRFKEALSELSDYQFTCFDNHASLISRLRSDLPRFVLNFCDEGFDNDAFKELHIPSFLEMLGIPYSGAGPACLGLCYNKFVVRAIAASMDIPVPMETYFNPDDSSATLPSVFPAIVKPNFGDSSVGITQDAVVYSSNELVKYLTKIRETLPGRSVLIEEFLPGPEYSIGIIGNPGLSYNILPPLEVDYSSLEPGLPHILGYESKWIPDSPYWTQISYNEANINDDIRAKLFDYSNLLFERCGCRDYARFDFRTDSDGEIKLLEVNPNPGWCWDGKLNYMAGFGGLRYADLLKTIIETAQERIAAENGFSDNVPIPKEKIILDRIPIVSTPEEVKVTDADLISQNLGA